VKRFALAFLLPSTKDERRWWWIVCLTAGICEEALYGGSCCTIFNFLPFHLSLTRARVLPSVIFGIEHCYQGVAGAGQTTPIGLLLATMLLATGNLLLPMAVHAMLDCA
jgi:membrane protease YdiL (CAAX protease family)